MILSTHIDSRLESALDLCLNRREPKRKEREKNTQLSSKPSATKINLLKDTTVTVDVLSQLSELSLNLQLLCLWTKFYGVTIQMKPGTIYLVCSSNVWVCGWNPMVWPFKWKPIVWQYFHMALSITARGGLRRHSLIYAKKLHCTILFIGEDLALSRSQNA